MKKKLGLILILFTIVITGIGWGVVTALGESLSLNEFISIPVFLALIEGGVILLLDKYLQNEGKNAERFVFVSKLVKVVLSLVFVLISYLALGLGKTFIIVFVVYYFAFIAFESWLFIHCNKKLIQKKEQHE